MVRYLLLIILLSAQALPSGAQASLTVRKDLRTVFSLIYNFEFDAAEACLSNYAEDEPLTQVLRTDLIWWKNLAKDGQKGLQEFDKQLQLQRKKSVFWNTNQGEIVYKSYQIRYYMASNQKFNGLMEYFLLKKRMKEEASGVETSKELAAYSTYYKDMLSVLEHYYFNQYFRVGSSSKLNDMIEKITLKCQSSDILESTLSHYFLFKLYSEISPDDSLASQHIKALRRMYPGNLIFKSSNHQIPNQLSINQSINTL